ncbi:HAD family hydrolase [Peribacillus frigoritolerans]|uniref:HAD family hydrolase n=1 Tax=Peribacillus frigoritolerans TaxID=450367 RepID=UPI003F7D77C1
MVLSWIERTISQKNIRTTIKNAQEQGTEIAIATGRAHFNVQFLLKEAGISAWILGANGATVQDKGGNLLRETSINKNQAKEILECFEEHDFYYEIFSDQVIYTPENGRDLLTIEMFRMKNENRETNLNDL